jgi:hypothetical protein
MKCRCGSSDRDIPVPICVGLVTNDHIDARSNVVYERVR